MNAQEQVNDGCQCSKAELDLFTTPPINISMDRGAYTSHHPIATLTDSAPIEFYVPGSPEEYIDLGRTRLLIRAKITKDDGSNIAQDAKVSTTNLLLHSLFSQVDCKLNEKLVTPSVNTYPYKAYLETILAHGSESTSSWLEAELFHRDTHPMNAHDHTADPTNKGLIERHAKIAQSALVEMVGRPHVDIFQQDRYLLNGVDMSLKFIRSAKQFHLMTASPNDFKLHILDATLQVRKVKVAPTIALDHASTLDRGIPAKYPMRRGIVSSFTVPANSLSFNKENLITGQLPRRIVLGMVANDAFNGAAKKNPFYFENYGLNFLTLNAGSQQFPSTPLTLDYGRGAFTQAFQQLHQAMGLTNSKEGLTITLETFKNGNNLYAFDLTADQAEGAHIDPIKYGSVRMEAHFDTQLPNPINVIVYAEYDNLLQVDKARNILTDFAPS